ncbi:hypothetical protein NBH13_01895 [Bifidobacterium sp. M3-R-103]|uniref:hypothetical protein n=1 Tax=Bifidobacterium sp. M3-R-103 TaxID=2949652 RepID=UPI00202F8CEA|nr:hypothetical protein [Bifidobacterium sp. M3-R-103]MCM0692000.1 hypothetical protein [Bifidobacterium sp. M3-R-103]
MKDSEADIAIGVLNKLIDQELEAVRAATRDGNTPFGGYAQTRHNAFLYARDEIRKALADAVEERDGSNPFLPQRDELVNGGREMSDEQTNPFELQYGELTTRDMHRCDFCRTLVSSPVYEVIAIFNGQATTADEVCPECMQRFGFKPTAVIPLTTYRKLMESVPVRALK